jgi:hypothetical protein
MLGRGHTKISRAYVSPIRHQKIELEREEGARQCKAQAVHGNKCEQCHPRLSLVVCAVILPVQAHQDNTQKVQTNEHNK